MTRAIANRHWTAAFEALVADLGGEFRRFGAVDAFLGNLPLPFANGCLVLDPADPDDVAAGIKWVAAARVPFQVRVDETLLASVDSALKSAGLVPDEERMPAMVLTPIPEIPDPPSGVGVAAVDRRSYRQFLDVLEASGIPSRFSSEIFSERLIDGNDARYFLATLEGSPAGISVAIRTGESGGIYSVATIEKARRRGVGTAVTWAAVEAIREWRCTAAVLQSSVMGYPIYRSMGFEEVVRYVRFMPPGQGAASV